MHDTNNDESKIGRVSSCYTEYTANNLIIVFFRFAHSRQPSDASGIYAEIGPAIYMTPTPLRGKDEV
jgi:hypothetical protein